MVRLKIRYERQRYVLFKIIIEPSHVFNKNEFLNKLWSIIWDYYGMNTANKIGLWIHKLDVENKYGIIQCSHKTKEIIISALSLIKRIKDKRVIFSPVITSGTIKKLKEKIPMYING
ncbi:MAG: hypothetical protein EU543_03615 [Promethearchaeota archaeon]|nr:MAG: hypothetical protein EU543_03615 [Candidatus Lokiarchaeota archaeon]